MFLVKYEQYSHFEFLIVPLLFFTHSYLQKEGELQKYRNMLTGWSRRYCKLDRNYFHYFASKFVSGPWMYFKYIFFIYRGYMYMPFGFIVLVDTVRIKLIQCIYYPV